MTSAAATIPVPFSPAPHSLNRDLSVSFQARSLYHVLNDFTTARDRTCFPGRQLLCKVTSWCPRTLEKYMDELINSGWIDRQQRRDEHGRYRGHIYTIHLTRDREGGSADPIPEPIRTGEADFTTRQTMPLEEELRTKPEEDNTRPTDELVKEVAAPSCVFPADETKPVFLVQASTAQGVDQATLDAINRQLKEGLDKGAIRNPGGYKQRLLQLAMTGEYVMPGLPAPTPATADFEGTRKRIEDYERQREAISEEDRANVLDMLRAFNRKGKS